MSYRNFKQALTISLLFLITFANAFAFDAIARDEKSQKQNRLITNIFEKDNTSDARFFLRVITFADNSDSARVQECYSSTSGTTCYNIGRKAYYRRSQIVEILNADQNGFDWIVNVACPVAGATLGALGTIAYNARTITGVGMEAANAILSPLTKKGAAIIVGAGAIAAGICDFFDTMEPMERTTAIFRTSLPPARIYISNIRKLRNDFRRQLN